MEVKIAVIGGTGVYDPNIMTNIKDETVVTPYGEVQLKIGNYLGKPVAFMNRHHEDHSVPPHLINYRANIAALKKLGVKNILATGAVGSLNPAMQPGHFIFVDQFIDFTKSRQQTFFDGGMAGVVHVDMTQPYCPELREVLSHAARSLGFTSHAAGTYVSCEGPRFETAAEIKMYRLLGGDLVGMTSVPEAPLARESEMCYATIAMVTNYAAGISPTRLTHQEVIDVMMQNGENIRKLVMQAIHWLDPDRSCNCHRALDQVKLG
ncbi:MAG: S-methyl-5'-thioadenosine phosphorylase [Desulfotomaculaceae bacterium]|nr:S-methyl-5'-thioadenosine phosphorylase [Desulfotomaculaceae bacterium]